MPRRVKKVDIVMTTDTPILPILIDQNQRAANQGLYDTFDTKRYKTSDMTKNDPGMETKVFNLTKKDYSKPDFNWFRVLSFIGIIGGIYYIYNSGILTKIKNVGMQNINDYFKTISDID